MAASNITMGDILLYLYRKCIASVPMVVVIKQVDIAQIGTEWHRLAHTQLPDLHTWWHRQWHTLDEKIDVSWPFYQRVKCNH